MRTLIGSSVAAGLLGISAIWRRRGNNAKTNLHKIAIRPTHTRGRAMCPGGGPEGVGWGSGLGFQRGNTLQ